MSDLHQSGPQQSRPRKKSDGGGFLLFIVLAAFIALGVWGVITRVDASSDLHKNTDKQAVPNVLVMKAATNTASEEVVLPGNVQAWHEAPIYARTSGYLKSWSTDIGAHVKAGDTLAEIETPEVDAQLHQAEADLANAQANNQLAQSTAKRWEALLKTNSVSKQEADEKTSAASAQDAAVASAKANVDRLNELEGFKTVTAPFDGVITARNTDTGALINAGSGSAQQELFHIAETDKLRVYVQVPQAYTQAITPDMQAELGFAEYPQRSFTATLAHSADAIDPITRTLLIQLQVDNDNGELMPGSYATVHLKLPNSGDSINMPVNTLMFRAAGMQVATVGSDGKVKLKNITIGRDYGKQVEVTSGLTADDSVIVNPPDSLIDGQAVHIVTPDNQKKDPDGKDKKDSLKQKGDSADDKSGGDSKK